MIPANELRIGNYVEAEGHPDRYAQIGHFSEEYVYFKVGHENFKFIEPIPLSPEWLIRFGAIFPYDDKLRLELAGLSFYYSPTGLLYLNDSGYNEAISKAVEFVHQLQNLIFSLTGEELTLKP